jgi:hypothetical protein
VAETLTISLGDEGDQEEGPALGAAYGVFSSATNYMWDNLGCVAGGVGMLDACPIGRRLVTGYISVDPLAAGPVYLVNTNLGGKQGLQIMPGKSSPALHVVHGPTGGSHDGWYVYNPNPVVVMCYSYGEYI